MSVCLDDDTNAYKAFLKANPKYNWTILYYDHLQKTKTDYNIFVTPQGFLINEEGKLSVHRLIILPEISSTISITSRIRKHRLS